MIKPSTGNRSILMKVMCAGLTLVLGIGLFGGAAMGSNACGMKCCCQSGPSHMKPSADMQMRSSMGCCSDVSMSPCDLKGAAPVDLPEHALTSCRAFFFVADGSTVNNAVSSEYRQHVSEGYISLILVPKFNSPPLYIQKLSFLI